MAVHVMYHITDFETAVESEKEDDSLVVPPQQQCLPVDDYDDLAQSTLTIKERSYLKQVRIEAAHFKVIRSTNQIPQLYTESCVEEANLGMSHSIWNSETLISDTIRHFKYIRKVIQLQRKHLSEARSDNQVHFDIARAVRTRQWWFEYCFGSSRSRTENLWEEDLTLSKDVDKWQNADDVDDEEEEEEEDDDDDNSHHVNEDEKLDFDYVKMALGESILCSLTLCSSKENGHTAGNAYATGHQPQISFLCELDQAEVIKVLRFFQIWLRRDGYRPQLGLWLYGLLSLLDLVQTGHVYHELRVLFLSCNQARMRTLLDISSLKTERDSNSGKLIASTCESVKSSGPNFTGNCVTCERMRHFRKQYSTLCLIMLVIGHFFGQRDLLSEGLE